jgi:GT2 family glycosyltransferase
MESFEESKTLIIVVKFQHPKVEVPCVKSIAEHTSAPYHLFVWDNWPRNDNLGKLWNWLIGKLTTRCKYVCLLNSDTQVTPGWLGKLIEVFDEHPNAGVVGPVTNHSRNHQHILKHTGEKLIIDFGATYPAEVLSGFCLVFSRAVWEEVGGFPTDFGFYGQEVDFIYRVAATERKQYVRQDVFVHHEGAATAQLVEKQGLIPGWTEASARAQGQRDLARSRK